MLWTTGSRFLKHYATEYSESCFSAKEEKGTLSI